MSPETLLLGLVYLGLGAVFVLHIVVRRHLASTRQLLAEIRQCNADFAKALTLLKGGNYEEALEVAKRWETRLHYTPPSGE